MSDYLLVIGNKAYSSWSLRAWLPLRKTGTGFDEIRIPLFVEGFKEKILQYSPAGRVPILRHGDLVVWDSLAICEYLAEQHPNLHLWPSEVHARAHARAVCAEMHAGFAAIRNAMPFNCRVIGRKLADYPGLREEIVRICAIWKHCRQVFAGDDGPWLFGHFTIADATYAPVALRFLTYGVELDTVCDNYIRTVANDLDVLDWIAGASAESEVIEACEVGK